MFTITFIHSIKPHSVYTNTEVKKNMQIHQVPKFKLIRYTLLDQCKCKQLFFLKKKKNVIVFLFTVSVKRTPLQSVNCIW